MSATQVKETMQKQIQKKQGFNLHADLSLSTIDDKTVKKYTKEVEASSRKGRNKPVSRLEPYLNIRNAISKAAGLMSVSKVCPVENMHSEDEVGIYIFGWHQTAPQLFSTKRSDAFLKKNNISLSTTEQENQQRVAHIGATVQAHTGKLTVFYLRIVDSNFPDLFKKSKNTVRKPLIIQLDTEIRFFLVLCHPDVCDTVVHDYIGRLITFPAIFQEQENTIKREIAGEEEAMQYGSQSQPSQPEPRRNIRTEEGNNLNMICDLIT